jgi:hypothetical protein
VVLIVVNGGLLLVALGRAARHLVRPDTGGVTPGRDEGA